MEQTSLRGIANKAAQNKAYRIRNLFRLLNASFLFWCWEFINRKASTQSFFICRVSSPFKDSLIANDL
jgi:hypothetical protein